MRWNTENVAELFKKNNCILLDDYKNVREKLRFVCSCGKTYSKSLNGFLRGPRCITCGRIIASNKKTYTQEEVSDVFSHNGCELLEVYVSVRIPVKYKCSCGEISKISFDNFKRGRRCKKCKSLNLTGDKHPSWIKDREAYRLNHLFKKKCYKALSSSLKAIDEFKKNRTHELLGYTPLELQNHVTSHKNWENVKRHQWHLDHIFPIKAFIDYGISDLKLINHLDNLQPLLANQNLAKSDSYNVCEFEKWIEKYKFIKQN